MNGFNGGARRLRPPTIADVAREAEVSVGTVSHVLSGRRNVRPETRARVEAAIRSLGFRPNRVARSLISDRSRTIGMVIPDVANPFFGEMMRGAEDTLGEEDFALVFGNSDNDADKEARYLRSFLERRLDGLMIAVTGSSRPADLEPLRDRGPVVLVDRGLAGWQGDVVRGDDATGMGLAVDHLVELGHRDLGLVNGERQLSTAALREQAFVGSLHRHGLTVRRVASGEFTMESGIEQTHALLDSDGPPSAICAGNDLLALGVLIAARARRLRIPKDLSVVGYDDIAYAAIASPALTTVRQPAYAMGAAGAKLMLERLRGDEGPDREIIMRPSLVIRGSTAPYSGRAHGPERRA